MLIPPYLKKNDHVALIATAKNFEPASLDACITRLEREGLVVVKGKNLLNRFHQFAGSDEERAADLQWAIDDEQIKAIFCARGGYGTARIIDFINFEKFRQTPKWIVGFSDVTILHGTVNNLFCESIHGIMPTSFGKSEYKSSVDMLIQTLFGASLKMEIAPHAQNRKGTGKGIVCGGNLTMLHTMINTYSMPDLGNKILFIEDIDEYLYHLDRMMVHFKRAGLLHHLAGLVVGSFSEMKDNDNPFGKTVEEIIYDAVSEYSYPVAFGLPSGHMAPNLPLIFGRTASLDVTKEGALLEFISPEIVP